MNFLLICKKFKINHKILQLYNNLQKTEKSMEIKKIICDKEKKLSKFLEQNLSASYSQIQKLIRNKNIKINGIRISSETNLVVGDVVEIYLSSPKINIAYEDDDIVVAVKPRQIETVSETGESFFGNLKKDRKELYAVHRLDRNTEGLVVFAKNKEAKQSLDEAFKQRTLHKFYLAWVVGEPKNKKDNLVAYLKKDENKSIVEISSLPKSGFEKIKTNYNLVWSNGETSILEVELLTGKTHQIRGHLAHIGYPIIGDEKYGDSKINKMFKKKFQCLCSYKIIFEFNSKNYLSHLNSKIIEIDRQNIDFCKNIT